MTAICSPVHLCSSQQTGFEVEIDDETGSGDCCCAFFPPFADAVVDSDNGDGCARTPDISDERLAISSSSMMMLRPTKRPRDDGYAMIVDRLKTMLLQQSDPAYETRDYLRFARDANSARRRKGFSCKEERQQQRQVIDRTCRTKMVQWMFQIVDYCNLSRESAVAAASHLDRFLSVSVVTTAAFASAEEEAAATPLAPSLRALSDRWYYQLAAIAALFLSIKTHEPVVVPPSLLSEMSLGVYRESDFVRAEMDLLEGLRWRTSRPTALDFARHLLALLSPLSSSQERDKVLEDLVLYQVELAVHDYELSVRQSPSTVAMAAIRNVLEIVGTSQVHIDECLERIRSAAARDGDDGPSSSSGSSSGLRDPLGPEVENVMVRLTGLALHVTRTTRSPPQLEEKGGEPRVAEESSPSSSKRSSSVPLSSSLPSPCQPTHEACASVAPGKSSVAGKASDTAAEQGHQTFTVSGDAKAIKVMSPVCVTLGDYLLPCTRPSRV
uniref:Cyclin N-terminal domain-containing protein n=1 Tax=Pseudictyota dubia TaxID=2749911 RepID=A0A7R9ZCX0_9STRA|mmetsp:Transcript_41250/g.76238  ORF Transcript_41250/g.76238 Transcript_41250/m.76238 type:complete len:497 (+) Transcript_41250:109-1599(+)